MMEGPSKVEQHLKDRAGATLVFFLTAGLVMGVIAGGIYVDIALKH